MIEEINTILELLKTYHQHPDVIFYVTRGSLGIGIILEIMNCIFYGMGSYKNLEGDIPPFLTFAIFTLIIFCFGLLFPLFYIFIPYVLIPFSPFIFFIFIGRLIKIWKERENKFAS